jgi:MFS family permease
LHNLLVGAFAITGIQVGSVTGSLAAQHLPNRPAIVTAMLTLGAGMWLLLFGVGLHVYVLVAVATLVTGAGGGLSYLAGLNIVNAISPPEHRAEMLSAFLVACYLGFSVPALLLGIAANQFGLFAAFIGAAVVLGAIAVTIIALTSERNLRVA